jgi:hypothetical protein
VSSNENDQSWIHLLLLTSTSFSSFTSVNLIIYEVISAFQHPVTRKPDRQVVSWQVLWCALNCGLIFRCHHTILPCELCNENSFSFSFFVASHCSRTICRITKHSSGEWMLIFFWYLLQFTKNCFPV